MVGWFWAILRRFRILMVALFSGDRCSTGDVFVEVCFGCVVVAFVGYVGSLRTSIGGFSTIGGFVAEGGLMSCERNFLKLISDKVPPINRRFPKRHKQIG